MKRLPVFLFCMGISCLLSAQEYIRPPDISKSGYTKMETKTDETGRKITIERYYDSVTNALQRETVIRQSFDNSGKEADITYYRINGTKEATYRRRYNEKGQMIWEEYLHYEPDGRIMEGELQYKPEYDPWKHYIWDHHKQKFMGYDKVAAAGKLPEATSGNVSQTTGSNAALCALPKWELFGGYSYTKTDNGFKTYGMPLGANVAVTYNLDQHWGLKADVSVHTKNEGDQSFNRYYTFLGVQYKINNDQHFVNPYLEALFGAGREVVCYQDNKNTGCTVAGALGGGLNFPLNDKIDLGIRGHYLPTRFNKETQNNFRASMGLKWSFGCKDPAKF